jgi:pRiA4b ORF-3-like protein
MTARRGRGGPPRAAGRTRRIGSALDVTTGTVHQLKVTLADTEPPIWRRVQVRSETTLAQLHEVLQIAMGWENYHLHSFGILTRSWERNDAGEATTSLAQLVGAGGRLTYVYDFGDDWLHDIEVEKVIVRPRPDTVYPRCTGGRRTCPPEDCGGPPGFYAMLQALRHRKGPRYHAAREFLDSSRFDVDAFDLVATNVELARLNPTPPASPRSRRTPSGRPGRRPGGGAAKPRPAASAWACACGCGEPVEQPSTGRPRLYASAAHRQRACLETGPEPRPQSRPRDGQPRRKRPFGAPAAFPTTASLPMLHGHWRT